MSKETASLPNGWRIKSLGDVATFTLGGTPSTDIPSFWGGHILWMASGDVHLRRIHDVPGRITDIGLASSNATIVHPPAVAIGLAGQGKTRGTVALICCELSTNQSIASVQGNQEDLQTEFLFHNLERRYEELRSRSSGGGRGGLSKGILEEFPISLPPLEEQIFITRILDTLDTTIRQTQAIIEKLKQVKQGLLHDLLTRGIDANGELRPPQSEAPELYKESVLGWIPEEWDIIAAHEKCTLITKGTTPAANKMWSGAEGIRFLRVDNLSFDGKLVFSESSFRINHDTHNRELARSKCFPGDVLTNIVGPPLGKLGLITNDSGEININQAIAVFRPKTGLLSDFLLLWMGGAIAQSWLRKRAKQTSGQLNLTLQLCQEMPIPCISMDEQQRIISCIENSQERIFLEISALDKLHQIQSGLMDDLLTGRVRVTPLLESQAA